MPEVSAEFVYHMEDVLDLYAEPPDARRPLVCFDERPCQLISETRQAVAAKPGQPERLTTSTSGKGPAICFCSLPLAKVGGM